MHTVLFKLNGVVALLRMVGVDVWAGVRPLLAAQRVWPKLACT